MEVEQKNEPNNPVTEDSQVQAVDVDAEKDIRVYVGGLNPRTIDTDILQRFEPFGSVHDIELAKFADSDECRGFGFLTLHTTDKKWKKCLSVYNGAKWRECVMKVQEATENYKIRMDREREQVVEETPKKTRYSKNRYAKDMTLVTDKNVDERRGWKRSRYGRAVAVMRLRMEDNRTIRVVDPTHYKDNLLKLFGSVRPKIIEDLAYITDYDSENDDSSDDSDRETSKGDSKEKLKYGSTSKNDTRGIENDNESGNESDASYDLEQEKQRHLQILYTMFGKNSVPTTTEKPLANRADESSSISGSGSEDETDAGDNFGELDGSDVDMPSKDNMETFRGLFGRSESKPQAGGSDAPFSLFGGELNESVMTNKPNASISDDSVTKSSGLDLIIKNLCFFDHPNVPEVHENSLMHFVEKSVANTQSDSQDEQQLSQVPDISSFSPLYPGQTPFSFYRTESLDKIREGWLKTRLDLTREYKRLYKTAAKTDKRIKKKSKLF
ncbi:putative RNA-binding protein [Zancudomyces culisetae]|uniref:Putative RNA-binding protein n=1 Tax=Zancudomyces culisetae TaxID=1213189 RepID=A0A1R1PM16_ZANCU|nr:putative RNA-binding protein [Zancudomyces culisetae]|eukprot:OMH82004.1 putative RNA-binding protein [Zancudomyces culisetae]